MDEEMIPPGFYVENDRGVVFGNLPRSNLRKIARLENAMEGILLGKRTGLGRITGISSRKKFG